jgi:hypothetical protein
MQEAWQADIFTYINAQTLNIESSCGTVRSRNAI